MSDAPDHSPKTAPALFDRLLEGAMNHGDVVHPAPHDASDAAAAPEPSGAEVSAQAQDAPDELVAAQLPGDVRRAMVLLLKHGVILARTQRNPFDALCLHREAVAAHLANMFLRVLIDERIGVALLQQQTEEALEEESEDGTMTTLLTRNTLTLYDTFVVLVLRKHYQEREAAGEQRVFMDAEQIESTLRPFLKVSQHDSLDAKHLNGALSRMQDRRLLSSDRGSDDRYEISPVIRHVVSAEVLEDLLGRYEALAAKAGIDTAAPT